MKIEKGMKKENDPMGQAIADYWRHGRADKLRVFSPMFEEDEIPVKTLFRSFGEMAAIEQTALRRAAGRTLDVGAGAGCHSLWLQQQGIPVTAIDISPLSVEVMKERGVEKALEQDFFSMEESFDTILMLMNGIGMVGTLERLPAFFALLDKVLRPGGQVLCDSSDISYVFENDEGDIELPAGGGYYGELTYEMQYRNIRGHAFPWLYIDAHLLCAAAAQSGYEAEIVQQGDHYDYLARMVRRNH
jgi:cyclopropane fatty-acyl-phospholipid synthase-like methyltransferase